LSLSFRGTTPERSDSVNAELVYPEQIDRSLNWPLGTAARLARRRQLPHYLLPDGSIRLCWEEIQPLVRRVPLQEQQEVRHVG
jgi:hypothetical protein